MSGPIRRVTIRGFRGVGPELPVQLDGRSLLLRGDNGSGKSSIGDALRWALTTWDGPFGHAPSLRHRALASDEAPRVTVELSAGGRIERSGEEPACDEAGLRFRDGCIRANPFFRRQDLQDLLSQGSTDRFAYLKSFFDLHQADAAIDAVGRQQN